MLEVRWSLAIAAVVALTLAGPWPALAAQPQLVVLKFTGDGFGKAIVTSATSAAESAALEVSAGRYKVVTRDMLAAVVGEQKLLQCEEAARCELDLGVGLGTGYMLAGSFLRIGAKAEVTVKLYDVHKLDLLAQLKESSVRDEDLLDRIGPLVERVLRKGLGDHEPVGEAKPTPNAATFVTPQEVSPPTPPPTPVLRTEAASSVPPGMVQLAGGTFSRTEPGRQATVSVRPFLLDITSVTVAKYKTCVKAGMCTAAGSGADCNWGKADRADHPVNCVDWNQARAYCAAAGKRLPTEDEREWAARGAEQGTTYPWGNDEPTDQVCWDGTGNNRKARGFKTTCPVGSYPAGDSPQGLKDLAGNVLEWTSSTYLFPDKRVVRGGCWDLVVEGGLAAAARVGFFPTSRGSSTGFRCARTP
jgi:formylglycine-generating enzyme required for sulfatase activity